MNKKINIKHVKHTDICYNTKTESYIQINNVIKRKCKRTVVIYSYVGKPHIKHWMYLSELTRRKLLVGPTVWEIL